MVDDDADGEVAFRPDFAARVLAAAEARRRRRLLLRWAGAAAAVLVVTAAGLGMRPSLAPQQRPQAAQVPELVESVNALSLGAETRTEPLDFMFPDAAPLARFSERYGRSGFGASVSDNVIFADEAEESDGD
jgi:hypothetical protein